MKYKARSTDITNIQIFSHLVGLLSKLSSTCCYRIAKELAYFAVATGVSSGGTAVHCCFSHSEIFNGEVRFAGLSDQLNEIVLDVSVERLAACLRPSAMLNTTSLTVKLSRRNGTPTLQIVLDYANPVSARSVSHEIGIRIVNPTLWNEIGVIPTEIRQTQYELHAVIGNARLCRSILERFKNVANTIDIAVRKHGQLVVMGESAVASTVSYVDVHVFGHAAYTARRNRDRRAGTNAARGTAPARGGVTNDNEPDQTEADTEVVEDGRALLDIVESLRHDPDSHRRTLANAPDEVRVRVEAKRVAGFFAALVNARLDGAEGGSAWNSAMNSSVVASAAMHTHTLLSIAHGRMLRIAVLNRNFALNWYLPVLIDGDADVDMGS